ncbi:MAG: HAD family phosphatase [Planctomycetes bacterium]|nr:HAD family phosphatase [Planctomycetota bacterium]
MSDRFAVIFDMDGVLVDSYHAHFKSWQAVAAEEGLAITEADFAAQFGRTSREIIAAYWHEGSYTEDQIAEMDDRKESAFRRILEAGFPVMPGAVELLDSLANAGFALGLGSSGPPENIDLVLSQLKARSMFGAVVTGCDVTRGKPDPQVFLLAAQRLDAAPGRCAVVEDAPAGVRAANAAGMTSVGLASTGHTRESLREADLVVDALAELSPRLLRELIGPGKT